MIYWAQENRPDAFTDITVGNNIFDGQKGYDYNTAYCGQGFVATEVKAVNHTNELFYNKFSSHILITYYLLFFHCNTLNSILIKGMGSCDRSRSYEFSWLCCGSKGILLHRYLNC